MIIKIIREVLGRTIVLFNYLTLPTPIERTIEQQQWVDKETQKMALYQFYACPFCIKTRRAIHRLNLSISYKDAQHNIQHRETLQQQGGAIKVPCLRIESDQQTIWMYESSDIIDYLESRFAENTKTIASTS